MLPSDAFAGNFRDKLLQQRLYALQGLNYLLKYLALHTLTHKIADSHCSLNLLKGTACIANEEYHPMCKHKGKSQALGTYNK